MHWTGGPSEITNVPKSIVYDVYYLSFLRNIQFGGPSILYRDPGEATYEAETGKCPWRSVERVTSILSSHSKVSNDQVDIC